MSNSNTIEHCMLVCSDVPDETIWRILLNCATGNINKCTKCPLLQYKPSGECSVKLAKLSIVGMQRLKNSLALSIE
jgi:hypothetical protein